MELVVDVEGADNLTASHIAGLRGLNPDFMLSAIGQDELQFHRPFNSLTATWIGVDTRDRMVLHVVYDALHIDPREPRQPVQERRLRTQVHEHSATDGESLMLGTSSEFIIGNHQDQNQSLNGTVHYVAYYDQPLTPAEISNNAQRLLANDDR